jgi:phosphoglycerol transferase MdoB-like AlkP superfamily enzyme
MHLRDYTLLIKRLLFALLFFSLYRAVFYFYNFTYFSKFDLGETLYAYLYGLRFDLATLLIANLVFILLSLIPITLYQFKVLKKLVFVGFNMVFLGAIIMDWEFFTFLGKKMTIDIFLGGMSADVVDQSLQVLVYYWYLSVVFIATGVLLWRYYPRRKKDIFMRPQMQWFKSGPISFVILVITALGIRGGPQMRSISPKEAFVHDSYELGNLSINAAYTMVRSIGKKQVPVEKYFKSDKEAFSFITSKRVFSAGYSQQEHNLRKIKDNLKDNIKDNVVVIILESFSQEYVEEGFTPFFSELSKSGLYFNNNFANGRRSIEALPSIIAGIPSLVGQPIYQSQYQANEFYALPKILGEHGYQTAFYHGGKKGTMDFDAYCYSIGFDKYFALEDYPKQEHFDGNWGIYDHHYLSYFADELDRYEAPFFTSIFTLSSHQPYSIPDAFEKRFPKGSLEIHESIGYADESLRLFFEKAKSKPWFKDTLFVITADHTSKLHSKKFNNMLGHYRVPLLFYHPTRDLSKELAGLNDNNNPRKRVTQHADILPSIVDFLGIKLKKRLYYGSSVFNDDQGRVINFNAGAYLYVKSPYVLRYDKNKSRLFAWSAEQYEAKDVQDPDALEELLQELKAYIQYTNNGLRNNNIYQ